jgi:hypothetical protein
MLSPPDGLRPEMLTAALAAGWGLEVTWLGYLPVGFGSHHWEVAGADGTRWFVTADDLLARRMSRSEPLDAVFGRLTAALATAMKLSALGRTFVVAPVPATDGEPLRRLTDRFSVALYPFVDGESFSWGESQPAEHRRAVLDMIISIHTAPAAARERAMTDDLSILFRDELDGALDGIPGTPDSGPYGQRTAELVAGHRDAIRQSLAWYDALATRLRSGQPMVLTHGEPHPGNTMRAESGWLFIDWDTALISAPERDLFGVDPGDGSMLAAYQQATGITPRPEALELFRLRWDLTDIALSVGQFRAPHSGDANDAKSFGRLPLLLSRIAVTG